MKLRISILITLLASCFGAQGQDYCNLISPGTAFYSGTFSQPGYLCGVKADSIHPAGPGDTVYIAANTYRPMTPPGSLLDTTGGILGRRIEKLNNGWFRFYTAAGDTIWLNTAADLNDTWEFIPLPQKGSLMATCTSIGPETFLNVTDTVKTFTFQAKDSAGGNIPHFFNGKTLRLSRRYGLVHLHDFYRMPESTDQFNLEGRTSPPLGFTGLTAHDVYDFSVGDLFHFQSHENYMVTSAHGTRDHHMIKRVKSKQVAAGGAKVTYTFYSCDLIEQYDPRFGPSSWVASGTTSESYSYTESLVTISGSPVPDPFPNSGRRDYAMAQGSGYLVPMTGWNLGYYTCCWKPDVNYPNHPNEREFAKGLGMVHYLFPASIPYPGYFEYGDLVYYKKGAQTWGSPLVIEGCEPGSPLSINPSSLTLGYHAGESATMDVITDDPWTITDPANPRRFLCTPDSGTGPATVLVTTLDSNVTGSLITNIITVSTGFFSLEVPIYQSFRPLPWIQVWPDTVILNWETGNKNFAHIWTSVPWNLTCTEWPSWFSVSVKSGTHDETLDFTANEANLSATPRIAQIVLENQLGNRDMVVIQQGRYGLGVDERESGRVSIVPNPVTVSATISVSGFPAGEAKTISLFDLTGRMVFSDITPSKDYLFRRGTLAGGIYLLKVKGRSGTACGRIMISTLSPGGTPARPEF